MNVPKNIPYKFNHPSLVSQYMDIFDRNEKLHELFSTSRREVVRNIYTNVNRPIYFILFNKDYKILDLNEYRSAWEKL